MDDYLTWCGVVPIYGYDGQCQELILSYSLEKAFTQLGLLCPSFLFPCYFSFFLLVPIHHQMDMW